MNNIKKVLAMGCVALCATIGMAAPHHGGHHMGYRPMPLPHHSVYHHHHSHSVWGRGGSNFWPGFVGGVVGGVVGNVVSQPIVTTPIVTTPVVTTPVVQSPVVVQPQVVVQQPVTTVQNVWIEGTYVSQRQANGTVIQVWRPGHYEQRTIVQ